MKIRYIAVDGTETVESSKKSPSLEKMQGFIGGYVERFSIRILLGKGVMWVDEEGQLKGLSINKKATELLEESARLMNTRRTQNIVGNVIVIQPDD